MIVLILRTIAWIWGPSLLHVRTDISGYSSFQKWVNIFSNIILIKYRKNGYFVAFLQLIRNLAFYKADEFICKLFLMFPLKT